MTVTSTRGVVIFRKSGETEVQRSSDTMADASESQAVGRMTREGQEVSSAAQAALARASTELLPHRGDPRIAALVSKLHAISSPADFAAGDYNVEDGDDAIAKALLDVESIAKAEETSPALRERAEKARRDLQLAHLDRMGSGHARVQRQERDRERLAKASLGGRAA